MADGSLVEVEACLEISLDLGYISQLNYNELENRRQELAVMLRALIKSLRKCIV